MDDQDGVDVTLRSLIAELGGPMATTIRPDDRLADDLGLDSLQSMELLSRLSEHFGIDPDLDDVDGIATVGDVSDFVRRALAEAA